MNLITKFPARVTSSILSFPPIYKLSLWNGHANFSHLNFIPPTTEDKNKRKVIKWSEEEKKRLFKLVEERGTTWIEFLPLFPNRSAVSLARCYRLAMSKRGYREGKWSPEDDNSLRELMNIPAYSHQWKLISESIQRSPKSCQQRWKRRLDPTLNKSSWTPEEDRMIVENVEKFGRDWHAVVKEMPGRDHATVAERYDNYLAPYLKKGKWSFDESKLMIEGLIKYGRSWSDIHQLIPWRSRIYIRNFYDRAIQPGLAKLDPSLSEKERLQILLKNPEYIRCLIRT